MSEPLSTSEFRAHIDPIRHDLRRVREHLAEMNGRTRTAEQKIAVLESGSADAKQAGRFWGGLGALIAGAVSAWHFLAGGGR